jgi:hypothetical protein
MQSRLREREPVQPGAQPFLRSATQGQGIASCQHLCSGSDLVPSDIRKSDMILVTRRTATVCQVETAKRTNTKCATEFPLCFEGSRCLLTFLARICCGTNCAAAI